jgi:hypothetical protein
MLTGTRFFAGGLRMTGFPSRSSNGRNRNRARIRAKRKMEGSRCSQISSNYHRPDSVPGGGGLLAADPDAKLLAGGHSLLPAMKLRLASPSSLVDLGGIPGLVGIDAAGKITDRRHDDLRHAARFTRAQPSAADSHRGRRQRW